MTKSKIGLFGLGTMGSALALNIADNGYTIAVSNRTTSKIADFLAEAGDLEEKITGCDTLEELVDALETPRSIILMVPAGAPVDQQIEALRPLLDDDDLIIDAGNANFHDTNRRARDTGEKPFLGIGVSGGEEGARYGPSIMGGGEPEAWARVSQIMEDISAKHEGEPCAAWLGAEGAGHFVKAVHNGIEYADMQMIAEVYGLMRDGLSLSADAIGDVFTKWNDGPLQSYLIEISGAVAKAEDPKTGEPMLDVIVDAAGQKGTGRWTVIEAQLLASAIPAIDAAVVARNLSARRNTRAKGEELFGAAPQKLGDAHISIEDMENALIAGKITCYAQGFEMIAKASGEYDWKLPLPQIAKIWRAGCIIRSRMLDDMARALDESGDRNLMFAPYFSDLMSRTHASLRKLVSVAALNGHPTPALSSGLAYFDTMRTARGTANMIQGQRDYFGHHGFERLDGSADQHGPWVG